MKTSQRCCYLTVDFATAASPNDVCNSTKRSCFTTDVISDKSNKKSNVFGRFLKNIEGEAYKN
jgi:hypothetical protein